MISTKATSQNWGKRKHQTQLDLPNKISFQYLKDYLMTKLTRESLGKGNSVTYGSFDDKTKAFGIYLINWA
jgi:hypothetical protein